MRKSFVIALALSAFASIAPLADAQSVNRGAGRAQGRAALLKARRHGLFRGITLSAAEKVRVKEVRLKYHADNLKLRQAMLPAMQQARAARQKGDTAGARAILAGTKVNRDALRTTILRERNEIRAALTTENQTQFDANAQRVAKRHEAFAKKGRTGASGTNG